MKAEFTKFGVKHDYRGAHVSLEIGGRLYLGTITHVFYRELPQAWVCRVSHFNGEEWDFRPVLSSLEILERTYEKEAS